MFRKTGCADLCQCTPTELAFGKFDVHSHYSDNLKSLSEKADETTAFPESPSSSPQWTVLEAAFQPSFALTNSTYAGSSRSLKMMAPFFIVLYSITKI